MKRLFFLLAAVAAINSCTTKYIPVERVRVDSIYSTLLQRDSIEVRDSVCIVERGDTVFKTKYHYIYRDRVACDTFYHHSSDTVTKVVTVERSLSRLEALKMDIGGGVLWAIPVMVALYILYKRFKK